MKLTNIELEELQDYMRDKNIALIGNGNCIFNREYGSLIDSHDVVIRINGGVPLTGKYSHVIGAKFDIYSVNLDNTHWVNRGKDAKYILRLNPKLPNKLDQHQEQMLKAFPNVYYAFGKVQKQIVGAVEKSEIVSELEKL